MAAQKQLVTRDGAMVDVAESSEDPWAGGAAMLGLPGAAATKGSAGADAPAQGSSELSATSTIAPSRLLLAGWAAPCWRARRRRPAAPRLGVMPATRSSRSGCGRVPYKLPKCLALPVQL